MRSDGTSVSPSKTALISGSIMNEISRDEFGNDLSATAQPDVITGTKSDGSYWASGTCNGWFQSTVSGSTQAAIGRVTYKDANWTYYVFAACGSTGRLYCFEVDF
jgi:hypothetical protein